jgi:hypothetical protein
MAGVIGLSFLGIRNPEFIPRLYTTSLYDLTNTWYTDASSAYTATQPVLRSLMRSKAILVRKHMRREGRHGNGQCSRL